MKLWATLALVLVGVGFPPCPALAASADSKRSELSALREKIRSLQDDISRSEESHGEAADDLVASDKGISAAQRRLRDIARQRDQIESEIEDLAEQRLALENEIAVLKKQFGDAIFRTYVEGGQAGTRRFLSGDNPNQLSRDAFYLEQIARQRVAAIEHARTAERELQQVLTATRAHQAQIVALEAQQKHEQDNLLGERARQREVLAQISNQLRSQRKQFVGLQRDENRMEKLIQGLEKITRGLPTRPARTSVSKTASSGGGASRSEPSSGKADSVASSESSDVPFSERKGRLHWPVKGELIGRFGTQRAEGVTNWRGVFIRAASGAEVHAVAGGKVVFSDWMRGFGNLIILEHGDGYMTVYGNNESILKNTGDEVATGDVIASVGVSGEQEESGLYFEIRYRGQPQDPARWIANRGGK
jgi:murein hydrolase activator